VHGPKPRTHTSGQGRTYAGRLGRQKGAGTPPYNNPPVDILPHALQPLEVYIRAWCTLVDRSGGRNERVKQRNREKEIPAADDVAVAPAALYPQQQPTATLPALNPCTKQMSV